jgi:hypothetical protein
VESNLDMETLKNMPIGVQDFEKLRKGNYLGGVIQLWLNTSILTAEQYRIGTKS